MIIHQAFFGDKNGSHNLIASSLENKVVIGYLKLNTDIPASITITDSYLSGFPIEDYYVFTRTMNDPVSERPGMGFSHCLIVSIENLGDLNNIKELAGLFVNTPKKDVAQISDIELLPAPPEIHSITATGIELLSKLTTSTKSVVYLGYEHFESDLCQLWNVLPPALRSNFSFTISGSPNEISNEQISLIHTPESFEPRWSKFPIVKAKQTDQVNIENIRFLAQPKEADSVAFTEFIRVNSINFAHFHQYPPIAKLFTLSNLAIAKPDSVLLKRVIGAINELIPKPENGFEFKKQILSLFIAQVSLESTRDILLMRNMNFRAFTDGQRQISQLMDLWSKNFILPRNALFFPDGVKVLEEAYLPANPVWWREKITDQFDHLCETIDVSIANFVWKLWTFAPAVVQYTKLKTNDEQFIFAQKTLVNNPVFYQELSKFSKEKKWLYIYAESVSYELSPQLAVMAQLILDKSTDLEKHLDVIRNNVKDDTFFKQCLGVNNQTLHQMGGKLLVSHPEYFKDVDTTNLNWQKVWYESFKLSGKISPNDASIDHQFLVIIDQVLGKQEYVRPLLKIVALETGNILYHGSRKLVWALLETDTRNIILNKTCIYILNHFSGSEWTGLEAEIKNTFLSDAFVNKEIIKNNILGIAAKIEVLETVGKLSDKGLLEIIKFSGNLVNELEAETLMETIKKYQFGETLDYCYFNRNRYASFNKIVNGCKHMLSAWERLWLNSSATPVRLHDMYSAVDQHRLPYVFQTLRSLGFNDQTINRIQEEYVAGVKGIELSDLSNRLKTYIHSKS